MSSPQNAARALPAAAATLVWLLGAESVNPAAATAYHSDAAAAQAVVVTTAAGKALRKAALGSLGLMLGETDLMPVLAQMGAAQLLQRLSTETSRPVEERLMAARVLDAVVSEHGASAGQASEGGVEKVMIELLRSPQPELTALGCRGLARAAMHGGERAIVDAGGAKAMMVHLSSEVDAMMAAFESGGDLVTSSSRLGKTTLLHDALNAALNLSGSTVAQPQLAKHGLQALLTLWYELQRLRPSGLAEEVAELVGMAGATLSNLSAHQERDVARREARDI